MPGLVPKTLCQGTQTVEKSLVRQIGAYENNRTKTVFGATNKDYVGGEIDYTTSVNVT